MVCRSLLFVMAQDFPTWGKRLLLLLLISWVFGICMISSKADELLRNKDTFLMQMLPVTQNKDK